MNAGKIAAGVLLLVAVVVLIDLPLAAGVVALWPEFELGMLFTEVWSWPLLAALGAAHVFAVNEIVEGVEGK